MEYKHFDMKPMIYQTSRLNPPELLCQGTVDGYNFYIINQGTHPCGYVEIPKDHPYFCVDYDAMDICCHGGLTYGSTYLAIAQPDTDNCDRYFIGWDYGHYGDYTGFDKYFLDDVPSYMKKHTTEEIVDECLNVISQLKAIVKASEVKSDE